MRSKLSKIAFFWRMRYCLLFKI